MQGQNNRTGNEKLAATLSQECDAPRRQELRIVPDLDAEERTLALVSWTPWNRTASTLRRHASVNFNGWVINKIPVFQVADGSLSAGSPSIPTGKPDAAGKQRYGYLVEFASAAAQARWTRAVLAALRAAGVEP
jgi:hypothetical protein